MVCVECCGKRNAYRSRQCRPAILAKSRGCYSEPRAKSACKGFVIFKSSFQRDIEHGGARSVAAMQHDPTEAGVDASPVSRPKPAASNGEIGGAKSTPREPSAQLDSDALRRIPGANEHR